MEPDKTEKIVLYMNARDEKNLKEWVAHHLLIGFDEIYICDHKSIIPLKGQFDNFNKNGNKVFVRKCDRDGPIKNFLITSAAKHATIINADWMLYLDADEFFIFNTDDVSNVKDLMKMYKKYDLVAFSWLMFGSNGHEKEPEGFIIDNYTKSEMILCNHIKSFLRPQKFLKANAHKCDVIDPSKAIHSNGSLLDSKSVLFENPIHYYDSFAYVAHYYVQSKETYLRRKLTLPRDDDGTQRDKNKTIYNNIPKDNYDMHSEMNDVENYSIKNKYSEKIKAYLASIGEL